MPTAAVVVIGNEILTGKFRDENGPFFIERLRALGCDLVRIAVVRDEVDEIADEVRRCAAVADFVLTSGGVGPTHDDVTIEGIAKAFDLPMAVHPDLQNLLRRYGLPEDEANLRMATVPEGTVLEVGNGRSFPIVVVRNVWIFPGIPKLLRDKFESVADRFAGKTVLTARIYTDEYETEMAVRLTGVARRHPTVAIGSYPRFGEGPTHVILTLESRDADALRAAHTDLAANVRVLKTEPPP